MKTVVIQGKKIPGFDKALLGVLKISKSEMQVVTIRILSFLGGRTRMERSTGFPELMVSWNSLMVLRNYACTTSQLIT